MGVSKTPIRIPRKVVAKLPTTVVKRDEETRLMEEYAPPSNTMGETSHVPTTTVEERSFTLNESLQGHVSLSEHISSENDSWLETVKSHYLEDPFVKNIIQNPSQYSMFEYNNATGLIWGRNRHNELVLCIPQGKLGERSLREIALDSTHRVLGHLGEECTASYLCQHYWWPKLGKEIEQFCASCKTCQTLNRNMQKPSGLLPSLPIPNQPWKLIAMDFVGPFPWLDNYNYLWVIMDQKSSLVHLVPITTNVKTTQLADKFLTKIVRLHGFPLSIVSDCDPKFTAAFWRELHRLAGTSLLMSTSFHPQTDGITERTIQTISAMLHKLVQPDQTDWKRWLPMVEFAINLSLSARTGYTLFEMT